MSEKTKFEVEVAIKTSVGILYNMISTPSGLSDWFCEDVNIDREIYTFFWDGVPEKAKLLKQKKNEFVRYKWDEDEEENTYFDLRIKIDAITKDVALVVTDFSDSEDDIEEDTIFWKSQIDDLKRVIGA